MAKFNRFGNMNVCVEAQEHPYLLAVPSFNIIGNTYYVGTAQCSSILIDTSAGLVLLDTPNAIDLGLLVHSIYQLGFALKDLKYIIVSHAHMDHYGCVAALVHLTGAKVFMGERDVVDMQNNKEWFNDVMRNVGGGFNDVFVTDYSVKDGEVVTFGDTKIRFVFTPGHTVGCASHFWETEQDGKTYKIGIYGGAGFSALTDERLAKMHLDPSIRDEFSASIEKVWDEEVDVMLGNHPFHNDTFEKYDRRLAGEKDAFIDPTEWQRYLTELKVGYATFLKMPPVEQEVMLKPSGFMEYIGHRLGLTGD
jgi:metallo-beta-lactamase class B